MDIIYLVLSFGLLLSIACNVVLNRAMAASCACLTQEDVALISELLEEELAIVQAVEALDWNTYKIQQCRVIHIKAAQHNLTRVRA